MAKANGRSSPTGRSLEAGAMPASWYAGGAACVGTPRLAVHRYAPDFYILRQPACTSFEKPFLYLLFGSSRALLLDTGAGGLLIAPTVDSLVADWRARHEGAALSLIVAHSHGHNDHVAGDTEFAGREDVTIVRHDTARVRDFFRMVRWPADESTLDLGGRVLDVLAIPGHQAASIALYDRRTGVMLSGDTFYPGRLYVRDTAAFAASVARLVHFAAHHPVTAFLGAHIENRRAPGEDYPEGTVDQPDEHPLALARADLLELDSAVTAMRGRFTLLRLPHFTIWPVAR